MPETWYAHPSGGYPSGPSTGRMPKVPSGPAPGAAVRPLPGEPLPRTLVHDLPLRGGTVLARLTLPSDLTAADAERIAAFVHALALPVPEED